MGVSFEVAGVGIVLGAFIFLLLFQLAGEVTVRLLNLPLPGPVVGMFGLFAVLVIRGGVPENLHATSNTLLQHLMLLLVPATTGVMIYFNRLAEEWLAIALAGVGGAAVTMAATALTLGLLLARGKKRMR
jgi:holin-like protein